MCDEEGGIKLTKITEITKITATCYFRNILWDPSPSIIIYHRQAKYFRYFLFFYLFLLEVFSFLDIVIFGILFTDLVCFLVFLLVSVFI